MSVRKLSITMFAIIGLLLGSKIGLHLWQLPSSVSSPTESVMNNTAIIIPEPTEPKSITPSDMQNMNTIKPANSLAMIEAYLIPSANAEASSSTASNSIIEDETLSTLRQLKNGLDQRAKTLDKREQTLQQAEQQLKRRITELEQLEASIQQRLLDESKIKSKKIKRLTAVYEGMKPERSAPVIARMELATVVKIFLLMDEKKVGKILSFLPPEKAVTISQALTRQISSVK
ncbi:MAG: hypothetical protein JKY87_03230 [Mariprofundus sp.]|nr:hypothetical protein [Mariprofundus sp.]